MTLSPPIAEHIEGDLARTFRVHSRHCIHLDPAGRTLAPPGSQFRTSDALGNTMRAAGGNKERWTGRRKPTQYPSTNSLGAYQVPLLHLVTEQFGEL